VQVLDVIKSGRDVDELDLRLGIRVVDGVFVVVVREVVTVTVQIAGGVFLKKKKSANLRLPVEGKACNRVQVYWAIR
jgi:hypothetical protein